MIWARNPSRASSSLKELISRKKRKTIRTVVFWVRVKWIYASYQSREGYFHCSTNEGFLEKQAAQLTLKLENHPNEESEMMLKMLSNPANTITSAKL